MNHPDALLALALIGTARGPLPTPGPDPLGQAAAQVTRPDPEGTLLARAALHALAHAAGRRPDPPGDQPDPAPPETLPELPGRAARHLPAVIRTPLLNEWLTLCAQGGWRVPHALLPDLLDHAATSYNSHLRPLLTPVLGERGHWLARLHPDWASLSPHPDSWEATTPAGREDLWRRLREHDPQAARDLLQRRLDSERADTRRRLLTALLDTLTDDDHPLEPLLDTLTTDRSADTRTQARAALHRLPRSAQNARNAARLAALLGGTPPTPDDHATRDGLPDPPGQNTPALLAHLLAHTHPDTLLTALNTTPAALTALARQHDQLQPLAQNAVTTHHTPLAAALLTELPTHPQLLQVGPPETLAAAHTQAMNDRDLERLLTLLDPHPGPWTPDLSAALLTTLHATCPTRHHAAHTHRWEQLAELAATRAHPHTPHPGPLPDDATEWAPQTMSKLQATLDLRQQLWTDFGKERG